RARDRGGARAPALHGIFAAARRAREVRDRGEAHGSRAKDERRSNVNNPGPISPELEELLRAARPLDNAPEDARARLARRIALSAAVGAAGGAAARGGAGMGPPALPAPAPAATRAVLTQKILIGLASFAIGGGVGAGTYAALSKPTPATIVVQAPVPPPPEAP